MKSSVIVFQFMLFFSVCSCFAQDIADFKWKNRLVVLSTDSLENKLYLSQIESLESDLEGLDIRKLIIITLGQDFQITGLSTNIRQEIGSGYDIFLSDQRSFKFYLVGLDGGIKFSSSSIVDNKKLFNLIDAMPMRRLEIENNN